MDMPAGGGMATDVELDEAAAAEAAAVAAAAVAAAAAAAADVVAKVAASGDGAAFLLAGLIFPALEEAQ